MQLYAGIDLHSNNNYLGIVDETGNRIAKRKLPNKSEVIIGAIRPYREDICGVAVESTYNWYWLVDLLMDNGYPVHLANTAAIHKYSGLKHSDDEDDAFWLCEMLRLHILPEGYIYPREERPVRDLLRKRSHLVRLRTSLINSLQNIVTRNLCVKLNASDIKCAREEEIAEIFQGQEALSVASTASKQAIDFLSEKIRSIEAVVQRHVPGKRPYQMLQTIPGVGRVLGLTILLETGPIERFETAGDYASYCRKVPSWWKSNGKTKGKGNKKNGNRYLAWAFSEAAEIGRRVNPILRAYFDRKAKKTDRMVAHSALSHKLARAAYWIMRNEVPFRPEKLFP